MGTSLDSDGCANLVKYWLSVKILSVLVISLSSSTTDDVDFLMVGRLWNGFLNGLCVGM